MSVLLPVFLLYNMTDEKPESVIITTGRHNTHRKYHTEHCRAVDKANNTREISMQQAERMAIKHCSYCAGTHQTNNYNDEYQAILREQAKKNAAKVGGD